MKDRNKPTIVNNSGIENGNVCFRCGREYAFGRYNKWGYFEDCIECQDAHPEYTKEINRVMGELFEHNFRNVLGTDSYSHTPKPAEHWWRIFGP